ncbi:phage tail protein, partial [Staphylococcus xylosus]
IKMEAPKEIKIIKQNTDNTFEYKKGIKQNQQLILKGVHPILDNQRVGIDTNRQWLTLKEGFNDIEIIGENIGETTTQWIFPFIFK